MGWVNLFKDILKMDEVLGLEIIDQDTYDPWDAPSPYNEVVILVIIKEDVSSTDFSGELWEKITRKIIEGIESEEERQSIYVILKRRGEYDDKFWRFSQFYTDLRPLL